METAGIELASDGFLVLLNISHSNKKDARASCF